jgi:hypothetical protein
VFKSGTWAPPGKGDGLLISPHWSFVATLPEQKEQQASKQANMSSPNIVTCPIGHHKIANIHNGKVPSGTVKAGGQNKPAPGKYIKWDAEGVEVMQPGEAEKIQEVSAQFNRFQMMNFNEHMHCLRGTHLKTQGVSFLVSRKVIRLSLRC